MKIVSLSSFALVALTGLTSCTLPYRTFSLEDEEPARRSPNVVESVDTHGLLLSAKLLYRSEDCVNYFGHPLVTDDIVPILIMIENPGKRDFLLHRDKVRWIVGSTEISPIDPESLIREYRKSQLPSYLGLPLVIPYLVSRSQIAEYNFDLTEDYSRKALPETIQIRAGDLPFSYAVFFEIGPEQSRQLGRKSELLIPLRLKALPDQAGGDERVEIGLP